MDKLKPKKICQTSTCNSQVGAVYWKGGVAPALMAGTHGYDNYHILSQVRTDRVRKEGKERI